ncbi:MAG TPA: alpha/beta hydrolase [Anaerolineales bacterium]|nr:alpha/beta hydrolase [Anaerolineales bacterium]
MENVISAFIETNGVRLHVMQAGPEGGPLVILLHGFPEYWRGWSKQIEPLASAGFRLMIPDQRGYNLSEKPRGVKAYDIDILAQDVLGLIEASGRERALLIGHDWGAAVAWHVAAHYPERLEKLVILNVPHPAVMITTLRSSLRQLLKSWYIFFFQIPWLPEWLLSRGNFAPMRRMMIASSKPGSFSRADLDLYVEAWRQPGALTGMLNWYRAIFRKELRRINRGSKVNNIRIQVPTLILWGENDIALSRRMAQPSLDLCESGKLVFYPGATHWVQHEESSKVIEQIISFFNTR